MYVGVSSLENQTEADSGDVTERSHDDEPSTGMSVVSDDIYSLILSRRPFLGRLPKVDLIILERGKMSVRPSVHKKFLRFQ